MNSIENLKERIYRVAERDPDEMEGCTEVEIAEVEAAAGFPLPKAYREFLRFGGKRMGRFLWDCNYEIFYPKMITLNGRVKKKWGDRVDDPDNSFVFYCNDGEAFYFFKSCEGDDPPIYRIWGEDPVQRLYNSIWSFIEAAVQNDERYI